MVSPRHTRDPGSWSGRKTPNQAFTRTDLFAVIAVVSLIATLAVLCLLNSGNSRSDKPNAQTAQRLQCLANLKQLAAAEHMYAADNRGHFCPSYLDYHSTALKNVWMGALADYHGRTNGVWLCPSATNPAARSYRGTADASWTYTDRVTGTTTHGSYGINGYLGLGRNYKRARDTSFKVQNVFHLESAVPHPARTPVFNDAVYWNCILEETDSPSRNLHEPQVTIVATGIVKRVLTQFIARHGDFPASEAPRELASDSLPGAINMAFVDGHTETVPLEDLWTLFWHKNWDPKKVSFPHPPPK